MVELLFKVGIMVASIALIFAALMAVPAFAGLVEAFSGAELTNAIDAFVNLLTQYARPFVGLFNLVLGRFFASLLFSLIIWKLLKKPTLFVINMTTGLVRGIIQKLS